MAKRLNNDFTDAQGQAWSIQLFDSLYAGSTAPFSTVYGSPRLSWNGDPDETHAVTLPSKLSLEIVRTTQAVEDYLAAVPAREEGQLLVKVYKGSALEWIGVVLPETLSVPLDDLNGVASLEAVDALGLLSRLDYKDTDGTAFTGWEALTGHLLKILAKLPTWSHYASSDVVLYVADHLRPQQADGDQPANFYTMRTRVEHETFYEVDDDGNTTWMKCADVLAQIATVMGARMIHAAGAFYFVPSLAYLASDTPALYGFQKDGTGDTTFPNLPAVVTVDSGGLEDGWAIRHAPPVRAVFRSQEYLGNLALFRRIRHDGDGHHRVLISDGDGVHRDRHAAHNADPEQQPDRQRSAGALAAGGDPANTWRAGGRHPHVRGHAGRPLGALRYPGRNLGQRPGRQRRDLQRHGDADGWVGSEQNKRGREWSRERV